MAAEQAAARIQVELLDRDATIAEQAVELDELRAEVSTVRAELGELRAELIDTRNEIRHAHDREAAALARAEAVSVPPAESTAAVEQPTADAEVDAAATADRLAAAEARRRLSEAATASREFAEHLASLLVEEEVRPSGSGTRRTGRTALALPGGVISTSAAAAHHLVTAGAPIFVDGYNVAKLAWPDRGLEDQRTALIDRVENLARRHGADLTVVFDGASVVGAHAPRRRNVRVLFSPEGVTADDVIRAEVAHLPVGRPVIVVTNDREIVDDVRAVGANVIPSNAFIAVL